MALEQAAQTILTQCMNLKPDESCLIITDSEKIKIAQALFNQALKITDKAHLEQIPLAEIHGQEPPPSTAEKMLDFDVILILTTKSLSHTLARRKATQARARIASMPGITEEIIERTLTNVDFKKIKQTSQKLKAILDSGHLVHITTEAGTDITLSIRDRKASEAKAGLLHNKGDWGNLPSGEVCLAPVEGTTHGLLVVDASMAGIGKLEQPIEIVVRDGFAIEFRGGKQAEQLKKILANLNDKNAYNIAELGIGTNPQAIISGNILEDEKVLGTAHLALGDNTSYPGGQTKARCHLDGVFKTPTIEIDNKTIMERGNLKLEF